MDSLMLLVYLLSLSTVIPCCFSETDEMLPPIDESDVFAAELAEKIDQLGTYPTGAPENTESGFTFFPAFLKFSRLNKNQNGRPPVCFCCRTFVCHHQRCPCSKFIF